MMVTFKEVVRLKEETGASLNDCHYALLEAKGDFEKAKELIKKYYPELFTR